MMSLYLSIVGDLLFFVDHIDNDIWIGVDICGLL